MKIFGLYESELKGIEFQYQRIKISLEFIEFVRTVLNKFTNNPLKFLDIGDDLINEIGMYIDFNKILSRKLESNIIFISKNSSIRLPKKVFHRTLGTPEFQYFLTNTIITPKEYKYFSSLCPGGNSNKLYRRELEIDRYVIQRIQFSIVYHINSFLTEIIDKDADTFLQGGGDISEYKLSSGVRHNEIVKLISKICFHLSLSKLHESLRT